MCKNSQHTILWLLTFDGIFFLLKKRHFGFFLDFVSVPFQNASCPQQDFSKCASGSLSGPCSEIREWQLMLSPHSGFTWCLRVAVDGLWVDQWANEKIFMVRSGCVVPLFWQPTVVVNSAPEHGSWWKACEKQSFFMYPWKKWRERYGL